MAKKKKVKIKWTTFTTAWNDFTDTQSNQKQSAHELS